MSNYHLTSDAQSDLIEIRRHTLQQWGKKQSEKYLSDLGLITKAVKNGHSGSL